jgi:hypothetical protein
VFRNIENDHGEDGRDTDNDGLTDCQETSGVHDTASTQVFTSDPRKADTDDDGLYDGIEVGDAVPLARIDPLLGTGTLYRVSSNPQRADTDDDGLTDLDEVETLTRARTADTDGDGLTDGQEEDLGLDGFFADFDLDGFTDGWEQARIDNGYDPAVPDVQLTVVEYAGDFSRGALCGDKTGVWGFCDGDSLAYLAGNLGAGFVGVGDIRDALASLADGNLVSAAASVAFIIPVVGDSASIAAKCIKHLDKFSGARQRAVLRWIMNQEMPDLVKLQVLSHIHGGDALNRLRSKGIDDNGLIRLAKKGQNLKVLDDALAGAGKVVRSPKLYTTEKEAQIYISGLDPLNVMERYFPPSGGRNSRRVDVYNTGSAKATEVKKGMARDSSSHKRQISKDVANRTAPNVDVDQVEWLFVPDANGRVGPTDGLLALLRANNIPYQIWIP